MTRVGINHDDYWVIIVEVAGYHHRIGVLNIAYFTKLERNLPTSVIYNNMLSQRKWLFD